MSKHKKPRELGDVLHQTFIKLNPRDNLEGHVTWEQLSTEKRSRYNATAAAVVDTWRKRSES